MFYPSCPKCDSVVESAENDTVGYANRHLKRFATGGMTGHAHPIFGLVASGVAIVDFVYRRIPGGGRKRCTNRRCQHEFN